MRPSGSEGATSFDRLHPVIQRWIWEQKWEELRDVQDRTIRAVTDRSQDVLIAASTAAGKTEAAFLPILTSIAGRDEPGFSVLYVSPLKALINDQFRRLDILCERMEIDVVRWHGDAPHSAKQRARRRPRGVALITPESIEAMLVRRPVDARRMLGALDYVVIDELHAFLQGPRGLHLASLLRRVDGFSDRRARRVGLSATIGDLLAAAAWLNTADPAAVEMIESKGEGPGLRLQVRGYLEVPDVDDPDGLEDPSCPKALDKIADHMLGNLRGSNNLVFAGSRRRVESLTDRLRERCEVAAVPNEFYPHHGSLSKELREDLEARLRNSDLPTTAVATTTLELGIDIGSVQSVAQVGAPRSLSSLRQRLGRSGRRKETPAVLRMYVRERNVDARSDPLDRLRLPVVRAVAAVRLLVERFVEPPEPDPATATVALHQTLSVIAERGGDKAPSLYEAICGEGPLSALNKGDYADLLRGMAADEARLIEQTRDGTVMLGEQGERLVARRDFYAIFETDQEWQLVADGRTLGKIPMSNAVGIGSLLVFAGQRWKVMAVDDLAKVLDVARHRGGKIPKFESLSSELMHDRLAAEMLATLKDNDRPAYLDAQALEFLREGRAAFSEHDLGRKKLLASGNDTHLLLWRGTRMNSVFAAAFTSAGLDCATFDVGVTLADTTPDEAAAIIRQIADSPPAAEDLAEFVANLRVARFDEFVGLPLLRRLWCRANAEAVSDLGRQAALLLRGGVNGLQS